MTVRWLPVLVLALAVLCPAPLSAQRPAWRQDYQAALTEAEERGAPIFMLFAGLPCYPAERMYRNVLVGEEFCKATAEFVCVICHLQETRKSYFLGWPAYLQQYFFTPSYVFAGPDGRPLLEQFTLDTQHRMLPVKRIVARLNEVRKRFGAVVPRERWLRGHKLWERGFAAIELGEESRAVELLTQVVETSKVPALARKAAWELRVLRETAAFERAYRELRAAGVKAAAERLEALDSARQGWFDMALTGLGKGAAGPWRKPLVERLQALLRGGLGAGRVKITQICPDRKYMAYYQIGVILRVDLAEVSALTVQYWVEVEGGRVFAGYHTLDEVSRNPRLRLAAYLPLHRVVDRAGPGGTLRFPRVTRVRFQVHAGAFPAATGGSGEMRDSWWRKPELEPLVFRDDMNWTWERETDNDVVAKGLLYGGSAPYVPPTPPDDALRAEIMVKVLDEEIVMPSMRTEVKLLKDMGQVAVKPLVAYFDPKKRSVYTFASLLADLRAPAGVPKLISALATENLREKRYFLRLLGSYGDRRLVPLPALLPLLADEDEQIRAAAAGLVGLLREEGALGPLAQRLALEKDEDVQAGLIDGIRRLTLRDFSLAPGQEAPHRKRALEGLAAWRRRWGGRSRNAWAVAGLAAAGYPLPDPALEAPLSPPAIAGLERAAEDKRWWLSYAALRILAEHRIEKSVPTVVSVLVHAERRDLRRAATEGVLASAGRSTLLALPVLARKHKGRERQFNSLLQALAGNHTWPGGAAGLRRWEAWLKRNGSYLYRPAGSLRFRLNRKARAAGRSVHPVTGAILEKRPAGAR